MASRWGASGWLLALILAGCAQDSRITRLPIELETEHPPELVGYMQERGCQPDTEYLSRKRPGKSPPYAYQLDSSGRVADAVMWCYRMEAGVRRNYLLVRPITRDMQDALLCPRMVEVPHPVGGLSFGSASFISTMDGFVRLAPPGDPAPARIDLPTRHIVSAHVGHVTIYACHAGEWWYYRFQ